jgi:tetratricopeptide (TPR) repeat protein
MPMHEDLYQQGIAQAEAGAWQDALKLFDQALQHAPDWSDAYYQRGRMQFKLNQFEAAIADYTRALLANPTCATAFHARALAHLSLGNLEAAVADAKDAIRLYPSSALAYHLLGTLRQKQGYNNKAIASYKKAGELYLDQQDVANCRRCLDLIRQLQPPAPVPPPAPPLPLPVTPEEFLQQAVKKARSQGQASALEDLNWAIQIDPQDVRAYVCRAQLRVSIDDLWGAISDYRQAARLYLDQSNKIMAKQMLDQIELLKPKQTRITQTQTVRRTSRLIRHGTAGRVSASVQRRLLRLVGDDRRIAAGLVERLRQKYPDMPEDWYWEKAIYDLERDRH